MNNNSNSTIPLFDDMLVNEEAIPSNYKNSFQSKFSFIKKSLKMKTSRKSNIDCILKKCKGKFFKVIHESLNLCLNIIVKRLPQKFIKNITINLNKESLNKKIFDIYHENNLLPSLKEIKSKKLIRKGKQDIFNEIVNCNYQELYFLYINSERYKIDSLNILQKHGKKFTILYNYLSQNFISYYLNSKPHNKKLKSSKKKNIINDTDKFGDVINTNLKCINLNNHRDIKYNKYFVTKNKNKEKANK